MSHKSNIFSLYVLDWNFSWENWIILTNYCYLISKKSLTNWNILNFVNYHFSTSYTDTFLEAVDYNRVLF